MESFATDPNIWIVKDATLTPGIGRTGGEIYDSSGKWIDGDRTRSFDVRERTSQTPWNFAKKVEIKCPTAKTTVEESCVFLGPLTDHPGHFLITWAPQLSLSLFYIRQLK